MVEFSVCNSKPKGGAQGQRAMRNTTLASREAAAGHSELAPQDQGEPLDDLPDLASLKISTGDDNQVPRKKTNEGSSHLLEHDGFEVLFTYANERASEPPKPLPATVLAGPTSSRLSNSAQDGQSGAVIQLDEDQRRISKTDISRPLLVVAGAGTGKTTMLCARIIEIIRSGADARSILVIAHTNKAAEELNERIGKHMRAEGLLPAAAGAGGAFLSMPYISTFHSWCYGLIRSHYHELGWQKCPLLAVSDSERLDIMRLALVLLRDCQLLVHSEEILGISSSPPPGPDAATPSQSQRQYVLGWEKRWDAVTLAMEKLPGASSNNLTSSSSDDHTKAFKSKEWSPPGQNTQFAGQARAILDYSKKVHAVHQRLCTALGKVWHYSSSALQLDLGPQTKKSFMLQQMLSFISCVKNRDAVASDYPSTERAIFDAYAATMQRLGLLDFDDLPCIANRLLGNPTILAMVRSRFQYLLVDEYQDFNLIQTELVLRLQDGVGRVTAVGDERQSIYAFRGSVCEHNFSMFLDRFVDARTGDGSLPDLAWGKLEHLTQNYRSHRSIVDLGNIITQAATAGSRALTRVRTPLVARPSVRAIPITVWQPWDVFQEATCIAEEIETLLAKTGCRASDIAILLRCMTVGGEYPTLAIEAALRDKGIPFTVSPPRVPKVPKRIHAFGLLVRAVIDPHDDAPLEYCLRNMIKTLGEVGFAKIKAMNSHEDGGGYLLDKAKLASTDAKMLRANARKSLQTFLNSLCGWQRSIGTVPLRQLVHDMLKAYIRDCKLPRLSPGGSPQEEAMLNGQANDVAMYAVHLCQQQASEDQGPAYAESPCTVDQLEVFVSQLTIASQTAVNGEVSNSHDKHQGSVTISTIHRAKGLEWDHVFLPQFNDGLIPTRFRPEQLMLLARNQTAESAEASHYDEERRLAYVAVTRAKHGLYISAAQCLNLPGMQFHKGECPPSRFIPKAMLLGEND
ncbi:hypothetical protein GGF46_004145 [Coemansia sp. RSA 552]|nr:hypothetical protein GGF46_004145 [Coemansia sp. RSA 552]